VSLTLGQVTPLVDGAYVLFSRLTDLYGNSTQSAESLTVTIDNRVAGAPSIPDLTAASDSGVSSIDNVTRLIRPSFSIDIGGVSFAGEALSAGDLIQLVHISSGAEQVLGS
jgi:hypothetical protein